MKKNLRSIVSIQFLISVVIAFLLLRTVIAKFTPLERSVEVFDSISTILVGDTSINALMRIGTGVLELITSILLFFSTTRFIGAFLAAGTMMGALSLHFLGLGFSGANQSLAIIGAIVLILSAILMFLTRNDFFKIIHAWKKN